MTKEQINQADFLDMVFDQRNKDYGAYALRKAYPQHLYLALCGVLLIVGVTLGLSKWLAPSATVSTIRQWIPEDAIISDYILPKLPEVPKRAQLAKAEGFNQPVIVPDHLVTQLPPDQTVLAFSNINAVKVEGPELLPAAVNASMEAPAAPTVPMEEVPIVYERVEEMPGFPGGAEALARFWQRHLQAPDELMPGEWVKLSVRFVVNENGDIKEVNIQGAPSEAYEQAIRKAFARMPKWVPGRQQGQKVSVYFVLPIRFAGVEE